LGQGWKAGRGTRKKFIHPIFEPNIFEWVDEKTGPNQRWAGMR
jgi:hypothetical protein